MLRGLVRRFPFFFVAFLPLGSAFGHGSLERDRLSYGDLLQAGTAVQDPGYRVLRESRSLAQMLRRIPLASRGNRSPLPNRSLWTLEATLGWGSALIRRSAPYTPGEAGSAYFEEATGSNLDLLGSVTADVLRRGRWTVGLEANPALRWSPVAAAGDQQDLRLPVLLPMRFDLPIPLVVAPMAILVQSSSGEERWRQLELGIASGLFWTHRGGLTGLKMHGTVQATSLSIREGGEGSSSMTLASDGLEGYAVTASGVQLIPVNGPQVRIKAGVLAGLRRELQRIEQEGSSTLEPWSTAQAEVRAGGEVSVAPEVMMGLELFGGMGRSASDAGALEQLSGFGAQAYLRAMWRDRLELAGTVDLRRGETFSPALQQGIYQMGARFQLLVGLKY